jgi:hypothetical protein
MKGVLVVIALLADGVEPRNEAGAVRCDRGLELRRANRRREVRGYLGAERALVKVGSLPALP